MNYRLWYPQLDVYDTARRMLLILNNTHDVAFSKERLCICDFFFANPPLLHKTSMPSEVRKHFNKLKIPRPETAFLNYPPAPLLFVKMSNVQDEAIQNLSGRQFLSLEDLRLKSIKLSPNGVSFIKELPDALANAYEGETLNFICTDFAAIGAGEPGKLRAATGLRRTGL